MSKDPSHQDPVFPDHALQETVDNPNVDEPPPTTAPSASVSARGTGANTPNPTTAPHASTYGIREDIRDPDAGPPTNPLHHIGRLLWRFYCWNLTAEGIFCWKYTIISIAFWMPSVFKNSTYFVYKERGVWALIMAQTGLDIYGVFLSISFPCFVCEIDLAD